MRKTNQSRPAPAAEQHCRVSERHTCATVGWETLEHDSTPQLTRCRAALQALCSDERRLKKLKAYARFLVFSVPGVRQYADPDDLLNEAILRTLEGRRVWTPERVDLDTHLKGCIQSLVSQHSREAARYAKEKTPMQQPLLENYMTTMSIFNKSRARLAGDTMAAAVFDLLLEWRSPAEIREMLGIRPDVYAAARARVSRCLRRACGVLPSR